MDLTVSPEGFTPYMYRDRGVLIGYLLCGACARKVLRKSREGEIHKKIERNLIAAYHFERPDQEESSGLPS